MNERIIILLAIIATFICISICYIAFKIKIKTNQNNTQAIESPSLNEQSTSIELGMGNKSQGEPIEAGELSEESIKIVDNNIIEVIGVDIDNKVDKEITKEDFGETKKKTEEVSEECNEELSAELNEKPVKIKSLIIMDEFAEKVPNKEPVTEVKKKGKIANKKSYKYEPIKHGGGPRGNRTVTVKSQGAVSENIEPSYPQPEIVCWNRERQWIIAVEIPENITNCKLHSVLQASEKLLQDSARKRCYPINNIYDEVSVSWTDLDKEIQSCVHLGQYDYLIFKLYGNNNTQGRLVSHISSGWYVLISPENYRINTSACFSNIKPQFTAITGYIANIFYIEKDNDNQITVLDSKGDIQTIQKRITVNLIGNTSDIIKDEMPFFLGEPPSLQSSNQDIWEQIRVIILGEEGHGSNKWRKEFYPPKMISTQKLPTELYNRECGWYFIRYYDKDYNLIDSTDFKFASFLKSIVISPDSMLPVGQGHDPVTLTFEHEKECIVKLINSSLTDTDYERHENSTSTVLMPDEQYDKTDWIITKSNRLKVETSISLKRIWWTLSDVNVEPTKWNSYLVELNTNYFNVHSTKAIWIRISQKRWLKRIKIGFKQNRSREYIIPINENTIKIELREYFDSEEFNRPCNAFFTLWFDSDKLINLGHLVVNIRCSKCSYIVDNQSSLRKHIKEKHIQEYGYEPTYNQIYPILKERYKILPQYIYCCGYCGKFFEDDNSDEAQRKVVDHIERRCEKYKGGVISFTPINDPGIIRNKIFAELPYFINCTICDWIYDSREENSCVREQKLLEHIMEKHRGQLYYLI